MAKPKRSKIDLIIDSLSGDSIDCKPVNIDWREAMGEDCEGWRSFEPAECEKCGVVVVLDQGRGNEAHKDVIDYLDLDDELCPKCGERDVSDCATGDCDAKEGAPPALHCGSCGHSWPDPRACNGHVGSCEGPMMSYWYPVEISDCTEAARKLAHLPLCVIEFQDGNTGLALTGGGMDLSWEICEAFIILGKMPPAHFSDLPGMAGKKMDAKNRLIVTACIKSNEVIKSWADSRIDRIKRMVAGLRKEANTERLARGLSKDARKRK